MVRSGGDKLSFALPNLVAHSVRVVAQAEEPRVLNGKSEWRLFCPSVVLFVWRRSLRRVEARKSCELAGGEQRQFKLLIKRMIANLDSPY